MTFSLSQLLITITIFAVTLASITAFKNSYCDSRANVSVEIANRMLWENCQLPTEASDVTYKVNFQACVAEFKISENAFFNWCDELGLTVKRLGKVEYGEFLTELNINTRKTESGHVFYGWGPGNTEISGIYDGDISRAIIFETSF